MRVLHFSGYVDPEGRPPEELVAAWPTLLGAARAVVTAGASVEVLQAARHDAVVDERGVRLRFVRERPYPALRRRLGHRAAPHPWRTLRAARESDAEVVHLQGLSFPLQAMALRRALPGRPLLAQDHADRATAGWRRHLHRAGLRALDAVAFTAAAQARPFRDAGLLPDTTRVFEVVEGSTDFVPAGRAEARARSGVHGQPAVLWVGRLDTNKDPITALEAVTAAIDRLPGLRLWMVQREGDRAQEVQGRLAARPDLASRVVRLGPLAHERMPEVLSAADVLLSTSRREGSGYTVIEALACGTPVVLSRIASHEALVRALDPTRLVEPGDAAGFAEALCVAAGWGSAERTRVRHHFEAHLSWPAVGRQLVDAYAALLGRARPGGGAA